MNHLPIESIRINRIGAKSGLKAETPEELSYLFIEQFFDKKNNKIKEVIWSEEGEEEQITYYEYDENGRLISEKHQFLFDEIEEKSQYFYEADLLMERKKEFSFGNIETTTFTYNEYKLPTQIRVTDDEGNEEEIEVLEYEGKNLVHYFKKNVLVGKESEYWLKYDVDNRLIEDKKWHQADLKTLTSFYNYSKNIDDPDIKIMNEKGAVIEAHIKEFNDKNLLINHEVQFVNNGLKKAISTFEYNDDDKLIFTETIDQNGTKQRSVISIYDEKGLLLSETKSEHEVASGTINTFTLQYHYTFFQ